MPKQSKTEIKKQIRNTTRLLKKKEQTLSSIQLTEMQRKLQYLQVELVACETNSIEVKMHQKYKYVKFIEMKKVARRVKQLERLISTKAGTSNSELREIKDDEEEEDLAYSALNMDELSIELQAQKDNINYITHYPKDYKYISLFTQDKASLKLVSKIRTFIADRVKAGDISKLHEKDIFGKTKDETPTATVDGNNKVETEDKDDFFI